MAALEDIIESIDELAKRGGISRNRALAAWYAITFFNMDEDDALEAAEADGGNDQGIDIVFVDMSSQEIVIIQAYCPGSTNKTTPKDKWNALTASLPFIKDTDSLRNSGRSDLAELIEEAISAHPEFSIATGLVSLGKSSTEIKSALAAQVKSKINADFSFFFMAQEDVISKYKALVEAEAGIPEDTLDFEGDYFEDEGEYGRAWVGSVTSKELLRLSKKYDSELFAGNVRLFLGEKKGGINEQIIKTAVEKPGQFWALNNGITIVADTVTPNRVKNKLKLKRFSIVNGCQTTSCLVHAGETKAKVLTRVIAAKGGLKNEIIRYNNSQNAVKIWAVRAADDIQKGLREEFKKIGVNYAPKQEGLRKKRNISIIELDKVTQFLASREQTYLIQAINNKSELFDEPYQKIFKKDVNAKTVYMAWLVGSLSDSVRQERLKELKDESPDDRNIGLLGIAGAFWIVYCAYKLIENFSDVESVHINLNRMNTETFKNAIYKYADKSVDLFYESAIDTYDKEEYGSFKSTLRSTKFLQKLDSKVNNKIIRMKKGSGKLSNLADVAKGIN